MNKVFRSRQIPWLLTIMFALGVMAACSSSPKTPPTKEESIAQWSTRVDKLIADSRRAGKVKQLGRQLIELKSSMENDFVQMSNKTAELNANYATTTDETLQFFEKFERKRRNALAQYRDLIFAMRREVSADEWKVLAK